MSEITENSNYLLLNGIKRKDYSLISHALDLGAPINDKTSHSNKLLFKSWHDIILLGDIGIAQIVYNAYPFKSAHLLTFLLSTIVMNNKDFFDFFLDKCIETKSDLNTRFGVILSNTCKVSPLSTYEEDFNKKFTSDYYLSKLLDCNINLNVTTTHPLVILADNNNFHSWIKLYSHMKKQKDYNAKDNQTVIIHSLYKFLDKNSFLSEEVQFFFHEFDKKLMFSQGLKKISHSSYKGKDLEVFCLEMFSQEPQLFLQKAKTLGKNNVNFLSATKKIILFDTLDNKLRSKNIQSKGMKI